MQATTFLSHRLHGWPTSPWYPEMLVGRGCGMARLDVDGIEVQLFLEHMVADHGTGGEGADSDRYAPHRVVACLDSAQWIKATLK